MLDALSDWVRPDYFSINSIGDEKLVMTDMANVGALARVPAQLPIDWYVDPQVWEVEKNVIFEQGPGYVGHQLMVPEVGDYQTLEWLGHSKVLVRNASGVDLLSNVCRHRQAIMLQGRGHAHNIVCPLHRWTYDLTGKLMGAPHFGGNPCLDLSKATPQNWNGLLFNGARDVGKDFSSLGVAHDLDFGGYKLDRITVRDYPINWKTFIEVYLEDYHVAPFHPGLSQFVNAEQLHWEFGDWYSVQTVGVQQKLARPGTATYQRWHEEVLKYNGGNQPKQGAIWLTYYPNVMMEWYPHVLIVSSIVPRGPLACSNVVEFYYPEEIVLFERAFVEAQQAAYAETAREDEEICLRMTAGRQALYHQRRNEMGPYQSPMEDGLLHFHEFLQRCLAPHG